MARHSLVLNISTGIRVDRGIAAEAIEACSVIWVVPGKTIRNAEPHEVIQLRNKQAERRQPFFCYVEVSGVIFRPTDRNAESHRVERSHAMLTKRVMGGERFAQFVRL